MNGSMEPTRLLSAVSKATKVFVNALEIAPSDPTDRATFLKSALKDAQATLLTSLFKLLDCDCTNPPILWVNTYVHAFTDGGDRRGMKIQEQVLFEPTPANDKLNDLVASVHQAIDSYIEPPNQARSMTLQPTTVDHMNLYTFNLTARNLSVQMLKRTPVIMLCSRMRVF